MKIKIGPKNHRVFPEINDNHYPYFCPQCDENFYGIELNEVEEDGEVMYIVESSNGELHLDWDGNVLKQDTTPECAKVVWFDLDEYMEFWRTAVPKHLDILDLRGILADGTELVWNRYRERAKNGELV